MKTYAFLFSELRAGNLIWLFSWPAVGLTRPQVDPRKVREWMLGKSWTIALSMDLENEPGGEMIIFVHDQATLVNPQDFLPP
jgi:hypothetical protein